MHRKSLTSEDDLCDPIAVGCSVENQGLSWHMCFIVLFVSKQKKIPAAIIPN